MFTELKQIIIRSRATLLEDALGMVTLFSLLMAALCFSGSA